MGQRFSHLILNLDSQSEAAVVIQRAFRSYLDRQKNAKHKAQQVKTLSLT